MIASGILVCIPASRKRSTTPALHFTRLNVLQRMVGPYVPDLSRALSLDAALSGPPVQLPSPTAPLSVNPSPFAVPPPPQTESLLVQQGEQQPGAAWEDGQTPHGVGSISADLPASSAAPSAHGSRVASDAAPGGEGQHRQRLDQPEVCDMAGEAGDEEDRIEAGYDRLGSVPPLSATPSGVCPLCFWAAAALNAWPSVARLQVNCMVPQCQVPAACALQLGQQAGEAQHAVPIYPLPSRRHRRRAGRLRGRPAHRRTARGRA